MTTKQNEVQHAPAPAKTHLVLNESDAEFLAKSLRDQADATRKLACSLEAAAQALEARMKRPLACGD